MESATRMIKAVFWDMDGTLIDSEPYWHEVEMEIARENGGHWSESIGWECSGKPVPRVAQRMIDEGTKLSLEEVQQQLVAGVGRKEAERMPWIPGVQDVLRLLASAGIPSVLVTASPRNLAENLVRQAPEGAFVGYVSGDANLPKKPNPAPYLTAAKIVGIEVPEAVLIENGMLERAVDDSIDSAGAAAQLVDFRQEMAHCIAIEDSMTGLHSAAASGATTLAQTGFIKTDTSVGPQFASINGYDGLTVEALERYVAQRSAALEA